MFVHFFHMAMDMDVDADIWMYECRYVFWGYRSGC